MQTSTIDQDVPPLVEITYREQSFETYVVSTDAVAEAAYLIREVLVDDCYITHGLQIMSGATVVDVGANIGLFGARALSAVPGGDVTYIGVEPVPANFTTLQYNLLGSTGSAGSTGSTGSTASAAAAAGCTSGGAAAGQSFFHINATYAAAVAHPAADRISSPYPGNILLLNKAVSKQSGTLPLTYYPRMPGNSTLRPLEKAALQQHLMPAFFSAVEEFIVPVITLQQLLQEAVSDGRRIDLLKVDVEGEELAVLQGLDEAGWQRVQQVVVEVHDCLEAAPWCDLGPSSRPAAAGITDPGSALNDAAEATAVASQHTPLSTFGDDAGIQVVDRDLPVLRSSSSAAALGRHHDVLQPAALPRANGRVMAVARMLRRLGFNVVVECCMLLEGAPASYIVYARRPSERT